MKTPAVLRAAGRAIKLATTHAQVAQTPHEVVWTLNKAKLYRYVSPVPAAERHPVPLLLVFALMNRPSIFDLRPGASFVEHMVGKGYDVFLLDWGCPGPEDAGHGFDTYALDYLPRAIRKMRALTGAERFSMVGWCIGAIITTIYAALRPHDGLENLVLLTAPLDFTRRDKLTFARWTDPRWYDLDLVLEAYGNMPGELIDYGARALKPVENYLTSNLRIAENLDDPKIVESWHAMNTWVTDLIPIAGAAFRTLIRDLYQDNRLIRGELVVRGERVDLSRIEAKLLTVIAEEDHIVPPCQSETIVDLVGSKDKTLVRVSGGHIGVMAGSGAKKGTWPKIESWLAARSGEASAQPVANERSERERANQH
jgi:polyhydroxyalkanoate synthase subunit PhaC